MSETQMVSEIGHAATPRFRPRVGQVHGQSWDLSQREIVEMRTTAKVAQVENAIRKPIEQATWSVEPNGAPKNIVALVAGDLSLPVSGEEGVAPQRTGKVAWSEHLRAALESIFTGVAFFEQVYEYGVDGLLHLRKLAPRPNLSILKIHVAPDGGLVGITQYGKGKANSVFIPMDRLVVYRSGRMDDTWQGSSVFAPARDNWLELMKLQKLNSLVLQRNGMGIAKYKGSALTDRTQVLEELNRGQELAESYAAGETAGFALPPGADMPVEGVTGALPDIPASMEYHANQIAIACNATHLNLTGSSGSYALANVQLGEFIQGEQSYAEAIADTATRYIVADLVAMNFPDYDGPIPMVTSTRIQVQKDLTPGDISQLVAQGALTKEPNLEGWLRSTFRIPAPRSLYDALKARKKLKDAEETIGVTLSDEGEEAANE